MPNDIPNPDTHRNLQTREGVVAIPREQKGVPLREYFKNAELPNDLERAVVYATPSGPVVARPDPVPWNEQHNEKAQNYADQIKSLIDEKGYYSRTLDIYAKRLADDTGHDRDEMRAVIVKSFEQGYGRDPFTYLQDRRQEAGLPVRDAPSQDYGPEQ